MMCSFQDCSRPVGPKGARGLCPGHYQQLMAGKDLTPLQPRNVMEPWLRAHIDHNGDECLTWPFPPASTGYGQIKWHGKMRGAHRIMCELAHGPAPSPDHEAAHSCGKGHEACVNPKHLRWATKVENKADMLIHGTRPRGERQGSAKLTTEAVRQMRALAGALSHQKIGAMFGVSQTQASRVISGKHWGHV